MALRRVLTAVGLLSTLVLAKEARAEKLYGATGGSGLVSTLYVLNTTTGQATQVGPEKGIGVVLTSMARHPKTGVMYGTTSWGTKVALPDGGATASWLVKIDLTTGIGTPLVPLRFKDGDGGIDDSDEEGIPDMAFAADGTLYGWTENADEIVIIDPTTGGCKHIPETGVGSSETGFTTLPNGMALLSPNGATGKVYFYDLVHADAGPLHSAQLVRGTTLDAGTGDALWAIKAHKNGTVFGVERSSATIKQDAGVPDGAVESIRPAHIVQLTPVLDGGPDAAPSFIDAGGTAVQKPFSVTLDRLATAMTPEGRKLQIAAVAWSLDEDDDGVVDELDNCLTAANPDQADTDGDGKGNACDSCPSNANPGAAACPSSPGTIVGGSTSGSTTTGGSTGGGSGGVAADPPPVEEPKSGGCTLGPAPEESLAPFAVTGLGLVAAWFGRRRARRAASADRRDDTRGS